LLQSVVEVAAQQPLARTTRLIEQCDAILSQSSEAGFLLKAEASLREIDANFSIDNIPDDLLNRRRDLVRAISQQQTA
jgi:MoxR-like ATPase